MKIAIASFSRTEQLIKKTWNVLRDVNCEKYVFVVEEELDIYQKALEGQDVTIVVGVNGLSNQRNFITDYFDDGEVIISIDDDIEEVFIKSGKSLQTILEEAVEYLKKSSCGLMGFPPTFNKFWNRGNGCKEGLYFIVGAFYLYKIDKNIRVTNSLGEDFERSVLYYLKDGAVVRNNDLIFKTKYWTNSGGMNAEGRKTDLIRKHYTKLYYTYPHLLQLRTKKIKKEEVVNLSIKKAIVPKVFVLPPVDDDFFTPLKNMLKPNIFKKTSGSKKGSGSRPNFKPHYVATFGMVNPRFKKGGLQLSASSIEYSDIYNELLRLGEFICPFEFQSIHILKNCVCPPHKDNKNTRKSVLISFGDYTGCNIVIEGKKYDAKHTPIIFDGKTMEHWNTDDLQGTKYSLIFY